MKHIRKRAIPPQNTEVPSAFGSKKVIAQILSVIVVGVTVWVWVLILAGGSAESAVYTLDVGQGDSQLVVLSSPDRRSSVKILIDAGKGGQVVNSLDAVLDSRDKYIDIAVVTHPDLDHFGGFTEVLKHYEVGTFITNGLKADSEAFRALDKAIAEHSVPAVRLLAGDTITYANNELTVLSPDKAYLSHPKRNESGIVLKLKTAPASGAASALFTADIGIETENLLMRKGYDLSADILKVGHHGSKYSSSENFISAVSPLIAVIGVGAKNTYGHPAPRVLNALSLSGADTYRTDKDGTIAIYLERARVSKKESGGLFAAAASIFTGSYKTGAITSVALAEVRAKGKRESALVSFEQCSYKMGDSPTHARLILNEVAWMGAPSGATHEWIELRNVSGGTLNLTGWQIVNENERLHFTFPQQAAAKGEFVVVARGGAGIAAAEYTFTGALRNSKEGLRLFDNNCRLVDEIPLANTWPAGDSKTKQTMERRMDFSWISSSETGGTPGTANSSGAVAQPKAPGPNAPAVSKGCTSDQININTAEKTALMKIRHIGEARAEDIIEGRPFVSLTELRGKVSGIGESRLADILAEAKACVE